MVQKTAAMFAPERNDETAHYAIDFVWPAFPRNLIDPIPATVFEAKPCSPHDRDCQRQLRCAPLSMNTILVRSPVIGSEYVEISVLWCGMKIA
jgi:hypothetical protein